jgi:predicted nucleic acid-binding protein
VLPRYRLHRSAGVRFWEGPRRGVAAVEPLGHADLETAWAIGQALPDQDFSIVDRTSFAVMERLGIHWAAAFDDDFAVSRFGPQRSRACDVIR